MVGRFRRIIATDMLGFGFSDKPVCNAKHNIYYILVINDFIFCHVLLHHSLEFTVYCHKHRHRRVGDREGCSPP